VTAPGTIRIGTSGWQYSHWKGPFYPEEMADDDLLPFYAERLRTVEINRSFYSLPSADAARRWAARTPEEFVFAFKASRYLTHMKKLKDPKEPLRNVLESARELGAKLGPILFQLPPHWHKNAGRLAALLELLPHDLRFAVELRDPSWLDEEVLRLLEEHGVALCIYELAGFLSPREVTADFVYLRLHGPGDAYEGSYDAQTLAGWAGAISTWSRQGRAVYCYFDNDQAGYAATNAMRLREMLSG
jgi:uncharacterized protein YecE (DUF72 family)